tara:strand:- start:108499 stop:109122 length:624 start_codon:yes stop_codon:yes gene_type:complete
MFDRIQKIDMSFSGILKSTPYLGASIAYWLTDYGVNIKFLGVFLLLWTFDIITGIIKSIVVPNLKNPSSATGLRRVASKFVMLLFPVILATIYSLFVDDAVKMLNWGLMILALHEGYSTLGNFYSIRTGKMLTEFDAVSYFIKILADWIRKRIDLILVLMERDTRDEYKSGRSHNGNQNNGNHNDYNDEPDMEDHGDGDDNEIMPED